MSSSASDIQARAVPERVSVSESYAYEQGRVRDDDLEPQQSPQAELTVVVPYDGNEFVTEKTFWDVHNQQAESTDPAAIQVGHLVFYDADRTNIGELPDVSRHGSFSTSYSMPLQIPLGLDEAPSDVLNCGLAAVATSGYEPKHPSLVPLRAKLQADDVTVSSRKLSQETSLQFDRGLRLRLTIDVQVPVAKGGRGSRKGLPVRIDIGIQWPTPTSLKSLSVPSEDIEAGAPTSTPKNLRYNPHSQQIEWTDQHQLVEEKVGDEKVFRTRLTYVVDLLHPGELADQSKLKGEVQVRIDDYLLSGLGTQVVDALGTFSDATTLEKRTNLKTRFAFSLDDVFTNRRLRPYFQLHFDGVIPNNNRIRDLKVTLKNQGFEEYDNEEWSAPGVQGAPHTELLCFRKSVGMESMTLVVLVVGEEYRGRVQTDTGRGETYSTEQLSGEMTIHLYGNLPRNDQGLIQEMNAVHRSLYNIASYVRSRR